MGPQSSPDRTLFQSLILLVKTLQFAWFIGHLCLILCVLRYTFLWTRMKFSGGMAEFCYRTVFISAATTYGIAVYKILCFRARTSQKIPGGVLSIAAYEPVQYLALALIWLFMPPWPIALLPYCIYSIFHVAVYTRSDLIPTLKTDTFPTIQANLIRTLDANVATLQTELIRKLETNVVPALQTKLQSDLNPTLQTVLQTKLQTDLNPTLQTVLQTKLQADLNPTIQNALETNLNLNLQATLKTIPVATAIAAPDADTVLASNSIADKIGIFVKRHYDMSMSVLTQTIISFFVPQWIYPIFYLITRITAPPPGASNAKAHAVPTADSIADNIDVFIRTYYDISMSVVTRLEVLIWFRLLFSAITFQRRSWIMIVLYTIFLRARYDRIAFAQLEDRVNVFLDAQNVPVTVRWPWEIARALTRQFYHVSDLNKYMGVDSARKKVT